ncbi:aldo/keto reductase [Paenibacillus cremeus]|uniref:Aldo/keto reductase n=1 Tax=Paenibacillus cremeus TaxID=2163881 RepID=A0A559JVS3_9BACL|nr:aldo/keto reductase [Paenibacillus cremeus]TVY03991.1 aldo/keto reductase [Paenibacillus cremeus]
MEKRKYGNTGLEFPILSFGAQRIVDGHDCSEEEAIHIVNRAIDEGITYFDTAPTYSDGQSEERLGKAFGSRRDQVFLVTKTTKRSRDEALRSLEASLKRLQTDYIDEFRLHSVKNWEEVDQIFANDGALQACIEAKEQGLIISGHRNPKIQLEAINRFPFDSALVPLSALDPFIYSFEHEFLPTAVDKGVAVVGMKVMGMGALEPWAEKALRYTFSLPMSTAILGMSTMEQLEKNLQVARDFQPMTDVEKLEFFKEIMHLTTFETMFWKSNDLGNPQSWAPRQVRV